MNGMMLLSTMLGTASPIPRCHPRACREDPSLSTLDGWWDRMDRQPRSSGFVEPWVLGTSPRMTFVGVARPHTRPDAKPSPFVGRPSLFLPLPSGERAVRHDLRAPLNQLPLALHRTASKSFGEQGEGDPIVREHPHPSHPRTCSARATTAIDGTTANLPSWASQVQGAKPSPLKGEGTERHRSRPPTRRHRPHA